MDGMNRIFIIDHANHQHYNQQVIMLQLEYFSYKMNSTTLFIEYVQKSLENSYLTIDI